ncbi:hypothetical protein HUN58_03895 [Curtobacterium sp. Csp1]|uniref:Uncharacterized protein n=1 Tax=Curtobacterium citreum TaxID=2036 RepID=A0ABT2HGT1_9MICO|nr:MULTISPECIES: hypothetical protein [Curtobacterium]MCS6522483.1 hypothetical protein [Curtobacterium citreum]QKS12954.1 hypothetical protein HUN60_07245 [Curtobacterium sp. csp3]QKS19167.1 hypothetical protein HUN58_03895 [Curtobacterium sp. Csp1]RDI01088.1 hypothetical protein DEU32_102116 [Curtobacterium sp. AG1037]TQJ26232.1 hypothetical protein FB462_0057 [Curtobacterium citreum]
MSNQQVVPPTRLGLTLSIAGFGVAVAVTALDVARDALGTPYSLAWVILVILMVYPPRLIRPGNNWARSRCRRVPAALMYGAGAATALGGATWAVSAGPSIAVGTGLATLAIAAAAATLPAVAPARRRSPR